MSEQAETHRIQMAGAGFGEADENLIASRAADIAHWNGRSAPNEHDREEALRELRSPVLPDLTDATAAMAERPGSGVPAVSIGTHVRPQISEDEETVADALVREGIEEADRDLRIASSESSPEDPE